MSTPFLHDIRSKRRNIFPVIRIVDLFTTYRVSSPEQVESWTIKTDYMSKKRDRRPRDESGNTDAAPQKRDTSPKIHQREKIKYPLTIRERDDYTQRQMVILEAMQDRDTRCVMIDGIYGSGKTYVAVMSALKLLNSGRIDQIIYVRNPVESSSTGKLGFTPGTLNEKFELYTMPLVEKLDEMLPADEITMLQKDNRIEGVPLGYIRGRNWNCKVIIVDEASSMTYDDLILLLTRCGEFTKIFIIGDSINQNDIGSKAGFRKLFDKFDDIDSKENGIFAFELREAADIVRSKFVRYVMYKLGVIKESLYKTELDT